MELGTGRGGAGPNPSANLVPGLISRVIGLTRPRRGSWPMMHHVECTYTSRERVVSTDPRAFVAVGSDSHARGSNLGHRVTFASGLSAIIVGGSIGGLTAALVL